MSESIPELTLSDRTIVVTGAAGGLGRDVCRTLLAAGAKVVAAEHDDSAFDALREHVGRDGNLRMVVCDATDPDDVARLFETASQFADGAIWGLLNIVGGFAGGTPVAESEIGTLERLYGLNLKSAFVCSSAFLDRRTAAGDDEARPGRIVNISSPAADRGPGGQAAYAATKAGVLRLTESCAEEVKGAGITVNAVQPGTIDTPDNRDAMPDADRSKWVTPEQIARVLLFLLSDAAEVVNGAAIRCTGRG